MPSVVAVLTGSGLPSTEDWNAGLAEQELEVVMGPWFPWTSEEGRFKVAAEVRGIQTAVDVVYAKIESRREWFPICHIMVPGAQGIVKFEWSEGAWRAEAGAWALAMIAGMLQSGRLFTNEEKLGLLPSAAWSIARELIASLPAESVESKPIEIGAEGEDGALLAGVLRDLDRS